MLKPRYTALFVVIFCGTLIWFLSGTLRATNFTIERVNVSSSGEQSIYQGDYPSVSDDGRYVVFISSSPDLVSGDTNNWDDVFMHDRQTGETTRLSLTYLGGQISQPSDTAAISGNGHYVAFGSNGNNLVPNDTNGQQDIFLRDIQTGATSLVSLSSSGVQANAISYWPVISDDGRYVAFVSSANNLVTGDTGFNDVFVRDIQNSTTTRASVSSSGAQGGGVHPVLNADGRYVAFESSASTLVAGDTNGTSDIFLRDMQTGTTTRVSVNSSSTQGNGASVFPSISDDGRYIAFASSASNLVSGDTNGVQDSFIRDIQTGQTTRVSVDSSGTQGNASSSYPYISGDGHFIAFASSANNLVTGDSNGVQDIFLHDMQTGETRLISVSSSGVQGDLGSWSIAISGDGSSIVFSSQATNLVTGDTNTTMDVFAASNVLWEPPATPTPELTAELTEEPTDTPTPELTAELTEEPTATPTPELTAELTEEPTDTPTPELTAELTEEPTATPTPELTAELTEEPTDTPTPELTAELTEEPTDTPTAELTEMPPSLPGAAPDRNYFTELPIKLTWNRVSGVIGYEIQVATNSTFDESSILIDGTIPGDNLTAEIFTIDNGAYYWRVRGQIDSNHWGAWSAVESFTLAAG